MIGILSFFGSALAKIFADKVIGFFAMKAILTLLFLVAVPILLNNFLYDIIEIIMNFASSQVSSSGGSLNGSMSFTGFMAFLIDCFQLPQALSVMVSALVLRLCLSMIPFIRL